MRAFLDNILYACGKSFVCCGAAARKSQEGARIMRWFRQGYKLGAIALWGALLAACGTPAADTDTATDTAPIPSPTEPATVVPVATETSVIDLTQLPSPTTLPDPTALPAPTALPTPTLPPLPTDPATEPTADPAATPLYLWPASVPESLTIDPEQSAADETGFVLELSDASGELQATILGGTYVTASPPDDPPFGAETTDVRGNEGYAFSTGGGWSLNWREQGTHISIEGSVPRQMAFTIAETLEPVDLDTWQARLEQVAP
jgi:hypothetical protein